MSMPTKGKYHHAHHNLQSHLPSHVVGVNINQAAVASVSSQSHIQPYNPLVLNNSSRFVSNIGTDYHVSGQNFNVQNNGPISSATGSVSMLNDRTHPLSGMQSILNPSILTGIAPTIQSQSVACSSISTQSSQVSAAPTTCHNSSADMSKQPHLQTQSSTMQPIYIPNQSRSSSQNYYSSGHRPQMSRSMNQRNLQAGSQSQVVNIPNVNATAQHTAIYPSSPMAMQPSTMFMQQGQVTGLHSATPQHGVFPINSQMPMQFAGPPPRHQTPNQYQYQTFQAHTLLTTYGYTANQHPAFFYHQTPNVQLSLNRGNANSNSTSNQHVTGALSNNPGSALASGSMQAQTAPQSLQTMSTTFSQTDMYSSFNNSKLNVPNRSKKPRTKAITDIVNPTTGKNISDEIYKDDSTTESEVPISTKLLLDHDNTELIPKTVMEHSKVNKDSDLCIENYGEFDSFGNKTSDDSSCLDITKKECSANTHMSFRPEKSDNEIRLETENVDTTSDADSNSLGKNIFNHKTSSLSLSKRQNDISELSFEESQQIAVNDPNISNIKKPNSSKMQDFQSIKNQIMECSSSEGPEEYLKEIEDKMLQKQKNKNKAGSRELNYNLIEKVESEMDVVAASNEPSSIIPLQQNVALQSIDVSDQEVKKTDNKNDLQSFQEPEMIESSGFSDDIKHSTGDQLNSYGTNDDQKSDSYIESGEITLNDVDEVINDAEKNTTTTSPNENEKSSSEVEEENSKNASTCSERKSALKYIYSEDQWSPINVHGRKVYGREFLMKLQNDPNSKIKPSNLPDLDVVLKDNVKIRSSSDQRDPRFKDGNLGRHDSLFPQFAKIPASNKILPLTKKSHTGKPKSGKPNVIHVSLSLREDVKLRETENAWKPTRLTQTSTTEEQSKTEALYKRVRSVLNKLTPQKFDTLVKQVRDLEIDTQERLQGVINLVFEKAVDEPNFSRAYARICKELSNVEVMDNNGSSEDSNVSNFRKLILSRCQTEFEKNTVDENLRHEKLKLIEECKDPEKKKELKLNLEEEERRMRIKSVGNIRFIGELFKQNMLTGKIMVQCIKHLLHQADEENLECLCKLLTTIGEVLESKNIDLTEYFKQMQQIANQKGKISSRIRFMLQDVIDLRENKWVHRRDDNNPKTMDQIKKEADLEILDIQFNSISLNTPKKGDRTSERKRIRGGNSNIEEGGWSAPVGRSRLPVYSVETSKLKNKPLSVDDMQLGSRSTYQWAKPSPKMTTPNKFSCLENVTPETDRKISDIQSSGSRSSGPRDISRLDSKQTNEKNLRNNISQPNSIKEINTENVQMEVSLESQKIDSKNVVSQNTASEMSEEEIQISAKKFFEDYIGTKAKKSFDEASSEFSCVFPSTSHAIFVHTVINLVLEKSDHLQNKVSCLFSELLSLKLIGLKSFKNGLREILNTAEELIIDVPKLWEYISNVLIQSLINEHFTLSDFNCLIAESSSGLRSKNYAFILFAELIKKLRDAQGDSWVIEKISQSDIQIQTFAETDEKTSEIARDYKLDFLMPHLTKDYSYQFSNNLLELLQNSDFDEISTWIQKNVGYNTKDPKFIRTLMTTLLKTSVDVCDEKWIFKVETFDKLQKLIQRFVDANESLELQCLFAVQSFITKIEHPQGLLTKIMTYLYENHVLSNEAFLAWEKNTDPTEMNGKSEALLSLDSFFILLKEADDISSGEDA